MKAPNPRRTARARELGQLPPAFRLADDDAPPPVRHYSKHVTPVTDPDAACDVTPCRRRAVAEIEFEQTGATSRYCQYHSWPHTRGEYDVA